MRTAALLWLLLGSASAAGLQGSAFSSWELRCRPGHTVAALSSRPVRGPAGQRDAQVALFCSAPQPGEAVEGCRWAPAAWALWQGGEEEQASQIGERRRCDEWEVVGGLRSLWERRKARRRLAFLCCRLSSSAVDWSLGCHSVGPRPLFSPASASLVKDPHRPLPDCPHHRLQTLSAGPRGWTLRFCPYRIFGKEYPSGECGETSRRWDPTLERRRQRPPEEEVGSDWEGLNSVPEEEWTAGDGDWVVDCGAHRAVEWLEAWETRAGTSLRLGCRAAGPEEAEEAVGLRLRVSPWRPLAASPASRSCRPQELLQGLRSRLRGVQRFVSLICAESSNLILKPTGHARFFVPFAEPKRIHRRGSLLSHFSSKSTLYRGRERTRMRTGTARAQYRDIPKFTSSLVLDEGPPRLVRRPARVTLGASALELLRAPEELGEAPALPMDALLPTEALLPVLSRRRRQKPSDLRTQKPGDLRLRLPGLVHRDPTREPASADSAAAKLSLSSSLLAELSRLTPLKPGGAMSEPLSDWALDCGAHRLLTSLRLAFEEGDLRLSASCASAVPEAQFRLAARLTPWRELAEASLGCASDEAVQGVLGRWEGGRRWLALLCARGSNAMVADEEASEVGLGPLPSSLSPPRGAHRFRLASLRFVVSEFRGVVQREAHADWAALEHREASLFPATAFHDENRAHRSFKGLRFPLGRSLLKALQCEEEPEDASCAFDAHANCRCVCTPECLDYVSLRRRKRQADVLSSFTGLLGSSRAQSFGSSSFLAPASSPALGSSASLSSESTSASSSSDLFRLLLRSLGSEGWRLIQSLSLATPAPSDLSPSLRAGVHGPVSVRLTSTAAPFYRPPDPDDPSLCPATRCDCASACGVA